VIRRANNNITPTNNNITWRPGAIDYCQNMPSVDNADITARRCPGAVPVIGGPGGCHVTPPAQ
jgi:hypothetical protein